MMLWSLVEWRAGLTPEREMLVDERGRRLSFAQFRDRAGRVSAALAGRGVAEDSPVAWQLPTTIEALVLTAALARLGAVQIPIMPSYGARDLGFVMRQTRAAWLICVPDWNGRDLGTPAVEISARLRGVELVLVDSDLPESGASLPAASADGDPVRWVFYTSGTTAAPKGARHTDGSVLASSRCLGERLGCTPDDRVGMVFPIAHIGGCGTWLGASLMFGTTLVLDSVFDAERTTILQQRERVTLAGSGTVFTQIYLQIQRKTPTEPLFPHVRAFTSGASPKPPDLHDAVKRELGGVGVLSGYGLTEAPILTMSAPDDPDDVLATAEGRICDRVDVRVVGADGEPVGYGEEGELRVKAAQVMRGYVDASLNDAAFDAAGYLRTGDLGRLDEHGNLTITGRLKDVIIRKGETLSARAIEEELLAHPQVEDVAVIGVPHPDFGEEACAIVVATAGTTVTLDGLTTFLDGRNFPRRHWPERLEIVATLPRTSTGKVRKDELLERCVASGQRSPGARVP